MTRLIRKLSALFCALQIFAGCVTTGNGYDPRRDPFRDLETGLRAARESNRRVLIEVGGNWCSWCLKLDEFFKQNRSLAEFLEQHFVLVRVNYSRDNENASFLSRYPAIEGYPHFFVLESDGTLLHSQNTGGFENGETYDSGQILDFLARWAPQTCEGGVCPAP